MELNPICNSGPSGPREGHHAGQDGIEEQQPNEQAPRLRKCLVLVSRLYQIYALWTICYFFLTKRKHPYSVFHVHPYLRWQIPRIPPRLKAHYSTRCAQTWHQTQAMANSEDQRRKEAGKLWSIMKMVKSCQIQIMMRIHTDGTSQKYQIWSLAWHDDVLNCILNLTEACSWRAYNTYSHMSTLSPH